MRWRGRRQSDNVQDSRGGGGGGLPGGFGRNPIRIPIGRSAGGGGLSGRGRVGPAGGTTFRHTTPVAKRERPDQTADAEGKASETEAVSLPALPTLAKTSKGSSLPLVFTVIKAVPSGVATR